MIYARIKLENGVERLDGFDDPGHTLDPETIRTLSNGNKMLRPFVIESVSFDPQTHAGSTERVIEADRLVERTVVRQLTQDELDAKVAAAAAQLSLSPQTLRDELDALTARVVALEAPGR